VTIFGFVSSDKRDGSYSGNGSTCIAACEFRPGFAGAFAAACAIAAAIVGQATTALRVGQFRHRCGRSNSTSAVFSRAAGIDGL